MADGVAVTPGTGTTISTDDAGASGHVQRVKLAHSGDGLATHVTADADGLLVNLGANNDVAVTGTVTADLSAVDNAVLDAIAASVAGTLTVAGTVTANAGTNLDTSALALEAGGNLAAAATSLALLDDAIAGSEMQVDIVGLPAPLSTTGAGTEAAALRVTLASDSTGVVSVDDNGGSLTVDGTVAVSGTVTVDGSGVTQPVSGTVTANAGSGTFVVSGAVTNAVLSVVGGGLEATAQRVTIASDSTGVVAVTDNAGSLTVDNAGTFAVQAAQSGTWNVADGGGALTVDNAGTFAVQAAQAGAWNIADITGAVSLPTGAASLAEQQTQSTALGAIQTAVEALDNAVAGSELQVDVITSALPTGASTAAKQPSLGTAGTASTDVITVQGIAAMTALLVDGSAVTQPVSAAALPLPAGAASEATLAAVKVATEATQAAVEGTLVVSGTVTASDGGTTLSVDDGAGSLTVDGTVAATQSGSWDIGTLGTITNPVPITDNAGSITVDGTVAVTDGGGSITVDGTVGITGSVLVSDGSGSLTVDGTVDVTDGGGSLTVDGTVAATQSGSWSVDVTSVAATVLPTLATTGTLSNQADQATNVTLLSSDAARRGFRIFNDSTVTLYVKYGATATTSSFTVAIPAGGYLEENHYSGIVDGIWASDASGSARITSLS